MNKLGNWQNPKEFLPLPDKLVLLKVGEYEYRFARFDSFDNGEIGFLCEADSDGGYQLKDVVAWCYAKLDKVEWEE